MKLYPSSALLLLSYLAVLAAGDGSTATKVWWGFVSFFMFVGALAFGFDWLIEHIEK